MVKIHEKGPKRTLRVSAKSSTFAADFEQRFPKSFERASVSLLTQLAASKTGDMRSKAENAEKPISE